MPRVYTEEQRERKNKSERERYQRNREREREKHKEYYKKNKKEIYERQKKYIQENKEKIKEKHKKYYQTPNGKKSITICCWKRRGVVSTDYNLLYDNYLASTNCEECGIEYGERGDTTGTWKCMDHCHETGLFRNFICCGCNLKRR